MAELLVEEGGGGKRWFLCVVSGLGMKRDERADLSGGGGEECGQCLLRVREVVVGSAASL